MKWVVENETGSDARMEARRIYPEGLNSRAVTLLATRRAVARAEGRIGKITHVRIGSQRPYLSMPVVVRFLPETRAARPTKQQRRLEFA